MPRRAMPFFWLLCPFLRDAFAEAGVGWGNSFHNAFPLIRIDQVGISRPFYLAAVFAVRTTGSDHRRVVGDLLVTANGG